jgi:hypothetical protein
MPDKQKEELKRKLQKLGSAQDKKNTYGRQYHTLSMANNALTTAPQKTLIPPNCNTQNNYG